MISTIIYYFRQPLPAYKSNWLSVATRTVHSSVFFAIIFCKVKTICTKLEELLPPINTVNIVHCINILWMDFKNGEQKSLNLSLLFIKKYRTRMRKIRLIDATYSKFTYTGCIDLFINFITRVN